MRCSIRNLLCLALFFGLTQGAAAADSAGTDLGEALLALTGSAAVFDSPRLMAALHDPQPLLAADGKSLDSPKVLKLLKDAGFHVWKERPRLWIVQLAADGSPTLLQADSHFLAEAQYRSLPLSQSPVAPTDAAVLTALTQKPYDAALTELLGNHQADALVTVSAGPNGYAWQLRRPGWQHAGQLPANADMPTLLPHVLCEALAATAEWPEANGRTLLHVAGVHSYGELMAAEKALQGLDGVNSASVVRVEGSSVWFALDLPSATLSTELDGAAGFSASPAAPLKAPVQQGRVLAGVVLSRDWSMVAAPAAVPAATATSAAAHL